MRGREIARNRKVYIACGGSAGHIFPGFTLAEELVKRYGNGIEVSFFTSADELDQTLFKRSGFNFYTLPLRRRRTLSETKIKRYGVESMIRNVAFALGIFRSSIESLKIILSNQPGCFVGFGAYVSGPPFLAAFLLGVPTLIHEQNAVMGKANSIMRHFATKVALSFPLVNGSKSKRAVITGNPIRECAAKTQDKTGAIDSLGLGHDKSTILVVGGSQGSRTINTVAAEVFKNMEKKLRDKIQVIHISGANGYERLEDGYKNADITHKIFPFFNDMGILYSAADVAISRAGASVIFELCAHKIPSILIPYPFAGSHQVPNAAFLASKGAAIMIEEARLTASSLRVAVAKIIDDENLRLSMGRKMEAFSRPDAGKKLADEVISLLG